MLGGMVSDVIAAKLKLALRQCVLRGYSATSLQRTLALSTVHCRGGQGERPGQPQGSGPLCYASEASEKSPIVHATLRINLR